VSRSNQGILAAGLREPFDQEIRVLVVARHRYLSVKVYSIGLFLRPRA
jgi:hypothetical protein